MENEDFLNHVRVAFDISSDSELGIDTLTATTFTLVETTAAGERKLHNGRYGFRGSSFWVTCSEAPDLSLEQLKVYDKLKVAVEKAKAHWDSSRMATVMVMNDEPDIFKPDWPCPNMYGAVHEHLLPAIHLLADELRQEGTQLTAGSHGSGPCELVLVPLRSRL